MGGVLGILSEEGVDEYMSCEDQAGRWGVGIPFLFLYAFGFPALILNHICRPDSFTRRLGVDLKIMYRMYEPKKFFCVGVRPTAPTGWWGP